MATNELVQNALNGRGLWLGLTPVFDINQPDHPILRAVDDPHVTIAHFGKLNDMARVMRIAGAARATMARSRTPITGSVSGLAYFWHGRRATQVAVINSTDMFSLRASLLLKLNDADVGYDDRYGFNAHVTLRADHGVPGLELQPYLGLTCRGLTLFCGDASEDM